MQLKLPKSDLPTVNVTVEGPTFQQTMTFDSGQDTVEVNLPTALDERTIEVTAQFCSAGGNPDSRPIVLKKAETFPTAKTEIPTPKQQTEPTEA